MTALLYISIAISVPYGLFWCNGSANLARVSAKTATTALLAFWAYLAGGPILLAAGLGLSALGDAFLGAGDEDRYLLPGMAAFFAAHVAYVALFWNQMQVAPGLAIMAAQAALSLFAAAFLWFIISSVDKPMRAPVVAYTLIILLMGNAALRLPADMWLVAYGAIAFIASDMILSFNLFRLDKQAPVRALTSRLVWGLYYGGQLMIAYGFVQAGLAA